MLRRITPANGYCLFFPNRREGERFVSGRGVWVWPLEQWKHVKLGLFTVDLPGDSALLLTTSEKVECDVKASFGIVVGTPPDDWKEREARLERATMTCPPTRSMAAEHRVELKPFFHDWARNHCRTALLNVVGRSEYIPLFEHAQSRARVQKEVEEEAGRTLLGIGLLLVHCTVVISLREPSGPFATPNMLDKWRIYTQEINAEIAKKRAADYAHQQKMKGLEVAHGKQISVMDEQRTRDEVEVKQQTDFYLREQALESTKKETLFKIEEQAEFDLRDQKIGAIAEEMAKRAQQVQLERVRRESELEEQQLVEKGKRNAQRFQFEELDLQRRGQLTDEQQKVAEKEVKLLPLTTQLKAADLDMEVRKGQIIAENVELDVLARGAHERHMQSDVLHVLPQLVENAARPLEKVGDIRIMSLSGGQTSDLAAATGVGSVVAAATVLPLIRELFKFVNEVTEPSRKPTAPDPYQMVP